MLLQRAGNVCILKFHITQKIIEIENLPIRIITLIKFLIRNRCPVYIQDHFHPPP